MNDNLLTPHPQTMAKPAGPAPENPAGKLFQARPSPPGSDPAGSRLPPRLARLDRVAGLIGWGLPAISFFAAARLVLQAIDRAAPVSGGWLAGVCGAICVFGAGLLGAVALYAILRVLVHRFSTEDRSRDAAEPARLELLAERIAELNDRLRDVAGAIAALRVERASVTPPRPAEESLEHIERVLRSGQWKEAGALFDGYATRNPDDPRVSSLRRQVDAARDAARSEQLSQLEAARQAGDPERVLELHQSLASLLDGEARAALETDLSHWFLRLLHNRLRTGKIQADLAGLASRVAEVFSHTVAGASLRASLPTLRRSAGLCPRCGQPYHGLGNACPACLARGSASALPQASTSAPAKSE